MAQKTSVHFGREHFIIRGEDIGQLPVARKAFYTLVGHVAIPRDKKLIKFSDLGLLIVPRLETDLGDIPPFAQYSRNPNTGTPSDPFAALCELYAIGTESLRTVTDQILTEELERPKLFSISQLNFCDELLLSQGIPPVNQALTPHA